MSEKIKDTKYNIKMVISFYILLKIILFCNLTQYGMRSWKKDFVQLDGMLKCCVEGNGKWEECKGEKLIWKRLCVNMNKFPFGDLISDIFHLKIMLQKSGILKDLPLVKYLNQGSTRK